MTDDFSQAYVTTSSAQGIIITGVMTPVEYADGTVMEAAMVGPFTTEQEAHDALRAALAVSEGR